MTYSEYLEEATSRYIISCPDWLNKKDIKKKFDEFLASFDIPDEAVYTIKIVDEDYNSVIIDIEIKSISSSTSVNNTLHSYMSSSLDLIELELDEFAKSIIQVEKSETINCESRFNFKQLSKNNFSFSKRYYIE